MRKIYLRILIGLIGIACSGVAAEAQAVDQVVAKIPHEFVVDGRTFPPGSYRVERASTSDDRELLIRNVDSNESALIAPTVVESNTTDHASLSFEHVGDELLLSKIQTADHVFTISVPRSEIMEAEAKSHTGTSAPASMAGGK
jgi:hypothetical protein